MKTVNNVSVPLLIMSILPLNNAVGKDSTLNPKHLVTIPNKAKSAPQAPQLKEIVVIGHRNSLATAQDIKRSKIEIVDSVVADNINKLPDINLSEALQRITGVQSTRDRGEGATVVIRGLSQVESLFNGRELFTAGNGRTLDFADLPSELISAINVYKTSSADHIEGGVGGLVDLRTHHPFDFEGRKIFGSAKMIYGNLADEAQGQFSTLLSNRWASESFGELGALVNIAYQKRSWREDQKSSGTPKTFSNLLPGQIVVAPSGTTETTSIGTRERTSGNLILQWRPSSYLELYAEGNYTQFNTVQNSHQVNVFASSSFQPGSVTLFPGTQNLQSITWTQAPVSILSFARDTVDRTKQGAFGATFNRDALTFKTDFSYTQSFNNLYFAGPYLGATAANFSQDLSGDSPKTSISGTDLLSPANVDYNGIFYRTLPFVGELYAVKVDGEYHFNRGLFENIAMGYRFAKRSASNAPGLLFGDTNLKGITGADKPGQLAANPYSDYFPNSIRDYLIGNLDQARDINSLRNQFGITTTLPTPNFLSVWGINEYIHSGYLTGSFRSDTVPIDGKAGLRFVSSQNTVNGWQSVPATNRLEPINTDHTYFDYLPSINLRYTLSDRVYLRAAVSQTLTRPNFNQLSPSLTLVGNSVDASLNSGTAGNPALKPVRADNFDVALEAYFDKNTSAYITGFFKEVEGFTATISRPETYNGTTYQVSRPQNSDSGSIKGFEVSYQQFFDFFPKPFKGFGLQTNYTFVDSEANNALIGQKTPLQNLSKHSYNIIGLYEHDNFWARIAYNWRDTYLSSVIQVVGLGALPVYTKGYGWLDASLGYTINDNYTLVVEGSNLVNTQRNSYFSAETRPQSVWQNDLQITATLRIKF